jgi:serine/threonine-protein kinase
VSQIGGTPFYMSPEAIRGAPPDPRFDWWGLSVVLFEALTGRRPFDGADTADLLASILVRPARPLRDLRPDLPKEIGDFFVSAFDRTSSKRPVDSTSFRAAVEYLKHVAD